MTSTLKRRQLLFGIIFLMQICDKYCVAFYLEGKYLCVNKTRRVLNNFCRIIVKKFEKNYSRTIKIVKTVQMTRLD